MNMGSQAPHCRQEGEREREQVPDHTSSTSSPDAGMVPKLPKGDRGHTAVAPPVCGVRPDSRLPGVRGQQNPTHEKPQGVASVHILYKEPHRGLRAQGKHRLGTRSSSQNSLPVPRTASQSPSPRTRARTRAHNVHTTCRHGAPPSRLPAASAGAHKPPTPLCPGVPGEGSRPLRGTIRPHAPPPTLRPPHDSGPRSTPQTPSHLCTDHLLPPENPVLPTQAGSLQPTFRLPTRGTPSLSAPSLQAPPPHQGSLPLMGLAFACGRAQPWPTPP